MLSHVLVLTDDVAATCAFYCDALGFEAADTPELPFPGAWLALDGTDPGADLDALEAATTSVLLGGAAVPPPSVLPLPQTAARYTVQVLDAAGHIVGTIPLT